MTRIGFGTNISSLQAQRRLGESLSRSGTAAERHSSGTRINHASDDAAGLAISQSLRTGVRIYEQAIRNVNDALSLTNIVQSALDELAIIQERQFELATQSANEVYSSAQRKALDQESRKLTDEYNRILRITQFNGQKLLDGSSDSIRIQMGEGLDNSLAVTLPALGEPAPAAQWSGTFAAPVFYSIRAALYQAADFDNDGKVDIATMIGGAGAVNPVEIHMNNGDGTFRAAVTYIVAGSNGSLLAGGVKN